MPKKLHKCVRSVSHRKKKPRNAWAVCVASLYGKRRKKRRKRGKK